MRGTTLPPSIIDRAAAVAARSAETPEAGAGAAATQAVALAAAADASPDQFVATLLARLAVEWIRATDDLIDCAIESQPALIVPAAAVAPGARVFRPAAGEAFCTSIRVMTRDGQVSLHLEDRTGRPVYVNLTVAGSPVVVAK